MNLFLELKIASIYVLYIKPQKHIKVLLLPNVLKLWYNLSEHVGFH